MTIRGIRWLQNLCRGGLVLAIAMTPALFLVESPGITRWIHAATGKNNYASHNSRSVKTMGCCQDNNLSKNQEWQPFRD